MTDIDIDEMLPDPDSDYAAACVALMKIMLKSGVNRIQAATEEVEREPMRIPPGHEDHRRWTETLANILADKSPELISENSKCANCNDKGFETWIDERHIYRSRVCGNPACVLGATILKAVDRKRRLAGSKAASRHAREDRMSDVTGDTGRDELQRDDRMRRLIGD